MTLSLRHLRRVSLLVLVLTAAVVSAANKTYYEVLGLPGYAKLRDIKKAYRRLAKEYHPDRNKGHEEEATVAFRQLSEAYEVLSDNELRREYDIRSYYDIWSYMERRRR